MIARTGLGFAFHRFSLVYFPGFMPRMLWGYFPEHVADGCY